jgi:ribosomal subunit interface protein
MDFQLTFKNMHRSASLAAYAQEKIGEKIHKYVRNPIETHLTFVVEGKERVIQCQVFARNKFNITVEARGDYMIECIDRLSDKLETRLRRKKEKMRSHKSKARPLLSLVENPAAFATGNVATLNAHGVDAQAKSPTKEAHWTAAPENEGPNPLSAGLVEFNNLPIDAGDIVLYEKAKNIFRTSQQRDLRRARYQSVVEAFH